MNITREDHQVLPILDGHLAHIQDIPLQGIVILGPSQKLVENIHQTNTMNIVPDLIVIDIEALVEDTGHHQIRATVLVIVAHLLEEMTHLLRTFLQIEDIDLIDNLTVMSVDNGAHLCPKWQCSRVTKPGILLSFSLKE